MAKTAQNPRLRAPMSDQQRQKLSAAQRAYVENDPRWKAHRAKLAQAQQNPDQKIRLSAAQINYMQNDPRWADHRERMMKAAVEATRLTLLPEEVDRVLALRRRGRNSEYIAEELCVSDRVIRRELRARDIPTGRLPPRPKAKRGKGYWRSFDDAHSVTM